MKKLSNLITLICAFLLCLSVSAQTARLQVIHNSPDAAASIVDIYVNDVLLLNDVAFRNASEFIDAPAGVDLKIDIAPSTSTSSAEAVFTATVQLASNESYIVIADGIVGSSGADAFGLEIFDAAQESSSTMGNVDVLVHHGSPDAPAVDVYESDVTSSTIVTNISYKGFDGYLDLPASSDFVLEVRPTGTQTPVAAYAADISGLADKAITVIASGFLDPSMNGDGPGFGLWVATDAGGPLLELPAVTIVQETARLQIIHNSPDPAAEVVDIYVNDDLLLGDVAFRNASEFIDAPAGVDLKIDIAPGTSTSSAEAVFTATVQLVSNESYIVIADGIVGSSGVDAFGLEIFDAAQESSSTMGNVDVLVHHGSPDAPAVDVYESGVTSSTVITNISYKGFDGYLDLPASADFVLEVRPTGTETAVAAYMADISGLADNAITVVASGFLDPSMNGDGPAFGLWVATSAGGPLLELPPVVVSPDSARLQIVHNSPDAAAEIVDIYLNDDLLLNDVAFRSASEFIDAPAGVDLKIDIAPGTSTSSAETVFTQTVMLTGGESYIVIANGIVASSGADAFGLDIYDMARESSSNPSEVDILVHHGSPDAPAVDIYESGVTNSTLVTNIAYKGFDGYLSVPPSADFILEVRPTGTPTAVASFAVDASGLAGKAVTILASGFLNPTRSIGANEFGLFVITDEGGNFIVLPDGSLSVEEFDSSGVSVFPNPADDELNINIPFSFSNATASIYDISGRQVSMQKLNGTEGNTSLEINSLNTGLYLLQLDVDNKVLTTKISIK